MEEKTIEFVNGTVVIIKLNLMMDFNEYEKFIKRVQDGVRDGVMIFPPGVDVIVIDKEGKVVKV